MKHTGIRSSAAWAVILCLLVFMASCGKDEQSQKKSSPLAGPYPAKSVQDEVQEKLKKDPNDLDALIHLADIYDRNAQHAESVDTYRKIVKLKPDMGFAYLRLGTSLDRLGRPEEAVEALRKAARYMPKYAVVYNNLGVAYGKLGRIDEEINALKKAVQLRPNYSSARFNLGLTYLKKGNEKAATREYEALRKFDEGAAEALLKEIRTAAR